MTSIQNIPIANASRPSQSTARRAQRCRRPDWARNAAPVITKRRRSRRPTTPRQFTSCAASPCAFRQPSGRATRLVRTLHRTDGDQDGQISGPAAPPATQPRCTRRSSPHCSRSRRTNSTQTETSYDDLRRACSRRDPGCIDPLRHVFEDEMSDVLPFRRTRFFYASSGAPDLEETIALSARGRGSRKSS